jgi:FecR-like protein
MNTFHLADERLTAFREGILPSNHEAAHLLDCRACSLVVDGDDMLRRAFEAARRVTPHPLGVSCVRLGQKRLAIALLRHRVRRAVEPLVTCALVAAAAWMFWHRPLLAGPDAAAPLAEIETHPDAAVAVAQAGPDEVVEVARGQAAFKVRRMRDDERFRVRCGRDEVEVRGTRFEVRGGDDGFVSVEVSEGVVELRTACCGTRLLRAGNAWERQKTARPSALALALPPAAPESVVRPSASAAPGALGTTLHERGPKATIERPAAAHEHEPEPEPKAEVLRQRALEAYDRGDYEIASRTFEAAARKAPDAPWIGDARTLAGAARVLQAPADAIGASPFSVAALDAAAQRAARAGDSARAAAARVAAARRSSGEGARKRWCSLRHDASVSPDLRAEAARACPDAP